MNRRKGQGKPRPPKRKKWVQLSGLRLQGPRRKGWEFSVFSAKGPSMKLFT